MNGLRAAGVAVDMVSSGRLSGVPDDPRFHRLTPRYGGLRNTRELAHLEYDRQVRDWLHAQPGLPRPDVVYHRHGYSSAIGPWLRADWGVPFVCEYNGSFEWMSRQWDNALVLFPRLLERAERLTLASADLVVTVSDALREDAIAGGAPADRVLVEPNGVDAHRYAPDADDGSLRIRYGIPEGAVLVGFIGTFGPWHGASVLARAATELLAGSGRDDPASTRVHFLLVGDGAEMPSVRRVIQEGRIADCVTLAGIVDQEEGPSHLAACDILASPHVPNPDGSSFFGSPTKLFEYMATSRAIVASDLDQIDRVLEHGRTAVLVPPGDSHALAAAIGDLARNPARRAQLGAAARRRALERHTWDRHVSRILDAMDGATGRRDRTIAPGGVA